MGFVRGALFGMKMKLNNAVLVLSVFMALFFCTAHGLTQQSRVQPATDFSSVEYFDPPNSQQMKSRISGAEAQPQAGGLLVIKQLKLETFAVDVKLEMVVEAPDCVYDTLNDAAYSPGKLQARTGDGRFYIEGEGFLWRQTNSFLTISNHVRSVIENAPVSPKPGKGALKSKTAL
jgi:hypothetical protein